MRRLTGDECLPWPTVAQDWLVRAAVGPDADVIAAFRAWRALVDVDGPMDHGSMRLLPLVCDRLRELRYDDPLMPRLKGVRRKDWTKTLMLFARTAPAVAALEAAGVRTMLIKGAPMALTIYHAVAVRPLADLDIVVRPTDAAQALRILRDLGWTAGTTIRAHELPDSYAIDLHADDGLEIDLHWHCLRETPAAAADDWFWSTAVPFDFQGVRTLQPSPTALLLHTVIHGVRSNNEPPLRWIPDAMTIMRVRGDAIDWRALTDFAARQKLSYRLHLGLALLARTYAAPVPADVLARLNAEGISMIERIENVICLGDPRRMYRPLLFPAVDYWRFLRNEPIGSFLKGYCGYLRRRWCLDHPVQLPLVALGAIGRHIVRLLTAPRADERRP